MAQADIAKRLVADDPGLVAPGRKKELMEAIEKVYGAEHPELTVTLDANDKAWLHALATHEDDLPYA